MDYDPFIESQLACTQLTSGPYVVRQVLQTGMTIVALGWGLSQHFSDMDLFSFNCLFILFQVTLLGWSSAAEGLCYQ